jgi:hypothetical protein
MSANGRTRLATASLSTGKRGEPCSQSSSEFRLQEVEALKSCRTAFGVCGLRRSRVFSLLSIIGY